MDIYKFDTRTGTLTNLVNDRRRVWPSSSRIVKIKPDIVLYPEFEDILEMNTKTGFIKQIGRFQEWKKVVLYGLSLLNIISRIYVFWASSAVQK